MALDERYILDITLGPSILDKTTGEPLANGTIYFYEDNNRNQPKPVYQLSGSPPNYTYAAMPNPITLNVAGQIQDAAENHVAIYYYPYDEFDETELYYIEVYEAGVGPGTGTPQFTREAWPNTIGSQNPVGSNNSVTNMLSNPQFHDVLFDVTNGLTISYAAGDTSVEIAPDWYIDINASASGSLTITRTSVAGTTFIPTNPPYTLDFSMGSNLNTVELRQRLTNNPAIWGPINGEGGYVATSVTINTGTALNVYYRPSIPGVGFQQTLLSQTNASGAFQEYRNTVQLTGVNNTANSDSGYVDIIFSLPVTGSPRITSLQVVGLPTDEEGIAFEQAPVNRQKDRLFNFYQEPLKGKRIPSWLCGWDFPMNPAQWGSTFAVSAAGANKSNYVWDQTIVFQSVNSGVSAARTNTGSLALTIAQNNTQVAVIQYLEQAKARQLLNGRLSVNLAINKSAGANRNGVVSLWYTTGASLPAMSSNNSLIATLDANGKPATFNLAGGVSWSEVARSSLGDAKFTITSSSTTQFNDIQLSGWDEVGAGAASTATFFAIVVGFEAMSSSEVIDIESISLTPGPIPTRPAAQTFDEVYSDCQRYFWKSFSPATVPAQNVGLATGFPIWQLILTTAADNTIMIWNPSIMVAAPTVTLYNPAAANANIRNLTGAHDATASIVAYETQQSFLLSAQDTGGTQGNLMGVHFTADARLGY